ncbi:MAG: response regulator [Ardenticatenaceae bacterium]|nr:response regulator [Ardenticatenaceae bacterium]MCB9444356.1 response regulator [Ardenticatenaceae bacterium]
MKKKPPKILIVDDDIGMVDLLERILMTRSFQVTTANNGRDALAIAQAVHPDLVLLDIMMPDLDGYEVCRQLKTNPETADITVVMLSALGNLQDEKHRSFYSEVDDRLCGYDCGADEFLSKPIRVSDLLRQMDFWTGFLCLPEEEA